MKTYTPRRPGRAGVLVLYLLYAAEVTRTLTVPTIKEVPWYAGLFVLFLILYTVVWYRPNVPLRHPRVAQLLLHLYLVIQCAITLLLLALNPELDVITGLFAFLAYQAPFIFPSPTRWVWVGLLVVLTGGTALLSPDPVRGLALELVTMAFCIALPALVVANEQTEQARATSQVIVSELQATHERLEKYAEQVEELATLEEHNRLARELHDSVSQTVFSIVLNTRSAQILAEQDPSRLRPHLTQLQTLTASALAQMRSLISTLRLPSDS